MQIVREIGFKWEEDALGRNKQSFRSAHESTQESGSYEYRETRWYDSERRSILVD
jgi:ribosomal protein L20